MINRSRGVQPSGRVRAGVLAATLTAGLLAGAPAQAVSGGEPAAANALTFVAKVDITGQRSCTGALVQPWWIVTAAACMSDGTAVPAGVPKLPTTATVGRTDLATTTGHVVEVDRLVPHPDRDLVLARLSTPVTDVKPVPISTVAPAEGEVLQIAGFGRTADVWVPDKLHTAKFSVDGIPAATTLALTPHTPTDAAICKGDAGGPALRQGPAGMELVAVHHTSWQGGCLANKTETRRGAVETRVDDLSQWFAQNARVPTDVRQMVLDGDRIGILRADGVALVKEGSLSGKWIQEHTDVKQLVLAGNRIGVVRGDGTALVKEGGLSAGWTPVHSNVKQLALAGNRIGVLRGDGRAHIKQGSLSAGWTPLDRTGLQQLVLTDTRTAVLTADGTALLKEGALTTAWTTQHTAVKQIALAGNRIGVLKTDGAALVKQGLVNAAWRPQDTKVQQLVMAAHRVGLLKTDGTALVKDGSITSNWTLLNRSGLRELALAATRIGVVDANRAALANEGALTADWVTEWTNAG